MTKKAYVIELDDTQQEALDVVVDILGYKGQDDALQLVFSDLLMDAVLSLSSKSKAPGNGDLRRLLTLVPAAPCADKGNVKPGEEINPQSNAPAD